MPTDASKIVLNLGGLDPKEATRITRLVGGRCRAVIIDDMYDLTSEAVHVLKQAGAARVWVGANFYDCPKVAARRAKALAKRGADGLTVHACGGAQMMESVIESVFTERGPAPAIFATLQIFGMEGILSGDYLSRLHTYIELSKQARKVGVDGIICPPRYLKELVEHPDLQGKIFTIADLTGKHCEVTPQRAIEIGADYILIGPQVTGVTYPEEAFATIAGSINPNAG